MVDQKTTQHSLKKDKYVNVRVGNSHFLDLFCSKCNQHLVLYQKDGHGRLLRMYLDRIFEPQGLSLLHSRISDKAGMPNLKCPKCAALIGTPMIYEAERRLAFRLIHGSFVKKKSDGVYPPAQQTQNTHNIGKGDPKTMATKRLTFGNKILDFYKTLTPPPIPLKGVKVIQPHKNEEVLVNMEKFFNKFFQDTKKRVFVIGINPGRLGSGATGVPFTDSIELENSCGIANTLAKRREISSEFLYKFIARWGGSRTFYKDFFFTGMLPLGLVRDGKNCNYYDSPKLLLAVKPFMVETLIKQFAFGAREEAVIILGSGKNQKVFKEMNEEHGWFKKVYVLEHPRFIMQYRGKYLKRYLKKYQGTFSQALLQVGIA